MVSRMKRIALGTLAVCIALLAVMQFLHFQQGYSPLRMLYSSQSEAQRLLRFLMSYHYQCNELLNSSEVLEWPMCMDPGVGLHSDSAANKGPPPLAYCIGPVSDFRFEKMLSQNLSSTRQLIFVPASTQTLTIPEMLAQHNSTVSVFHATVVANDPADFSRNSYDMTTVNNIMTRLGHHSVDILKLVHMQDPLQSYELLYFMAKDGVLQRFKQLHTRIDIEKADDDYLYSWYKTLFTVFHTAGFRLYHTSASSPLCLQVTTMESCQYFVSWVRDPGPLTHVLYPPALDGSEDSELQRLRDFVEGPGPQQDGDAVSVVLSSAIVLPLSRAALATSTASKCIIIVFIPKSTPAVLGGVSAVGRQCTVLTLSPADGGHSVQRRTPFSVRGGDGRRSRITLNEGLSGVLPAGSLTTVLYVDLGQSSWPVLSALMDYGALQTVKQLLLVVPVYPRPAMRSRDQRGGGALTLRQRYSELRRLTAFHMTLAAATPQHHTSQGDFWLLNFVKS